jgi:class 3 adenylate cyclase
MMNAPLTHSVPMSKDSSCINLLTCEHYIRRKLGDVPYDRFFDGILGNPDFCYGDENTGKIVPVSRESLSDSANWVSNKLLGRLYENTVDILRDSEAIYKAGRHIFMTAVGSQIFLMRFAGVPTIISRLTKENAKFNCNRTIEIIENKNGRARVRIHWNRDPDLSKYFCDMNRGVYEGLGRLTQNLSVIEETRCQFNGDEYCEYLIKWKAKPICKRWMDMLRYRMWGEIIDELERRIEEINAIRLRQESLIQWRTADLEKEKAKVLRVQRILSRYIAPQLAQKIVDGQIDLIRGHKRRRLTLFFSDIKDFTRLTDSMEPEDMAMLLNDYLSNMFEIIHGYGGTLANTNGDGLFVFFGAPDYTEDRDHALRCVHMAIDMQRRIQELRSRWFAEGIELSLHIRCGINTGMVTVGAYGSDTRKEYTAMGMHVNLASRLEKACEPGQILIHHSTWVLVRDQIPCESRGQIEAKGFRHPVRVYRVALEETPLSAESTASQGSSPLSDRRSKEEQ